MTPRTRLVIEGMKCDGCATTVRQRLGAAPGATGVAFDLATKSVVVEGASLDQDGASALLSGTKFKVTEAVPAG